MNLGSFLRSRYRIWNIFLGCQNFKYFFGVLEIPDIFWGWTVDAGPEPTYEEKMRVPPWGPDPQSPPPLIPRMLFMTVSWEHLLPIIVTFPGHIIFLL